MKATTLLAVCGVFLVTNQAEGLNDGGLDDIISVLITNGQEAEPHSAPFIAYIRVKKNNGHTFRCGGSLITGNYVLTAGHCVTNATAISVHLGAHNITHINENEVVMEAESWENNEPIIINDIAVIKLKESVKFTKAIQVVTLPSRSEVNQTYIGSIGRVYGWGKTEEDKPATALLYGDLPVVDNEECGQPEMFLCAAKVNKTGTCSGDSGGPFIINKKLVGLVHGSFCFVGDYTYPSVFTNVAKFLDWIEEKTDILLD